MKVTEHFEQLPPHPSWPMTKVYVGMAPGTAGRWLWLRIVAPLEMAAVICSSRTFQSREAAILDATVWADELDARYKSNEARTAQ